MIVIFKMQSAEIRIAQAKHEAFVRARGRHYSNEAEAMKVCYAVNLINVADHFL